MYRLYPEWVYLTWNDMSVETSVGATENVFGDHDMKIMLR